MKIRNGFVSNSSSSSFIVYTKSMELDKDNINLFLSKCERVRYAWSDVDNMDITLPIKGGTIDFNGTFEEYTSLWDRVNYITEILVYHLYEHGRLDDRYQRMEETFVKALDEVVTGATEDIKYLFVNYDYNLALKGSIGHSELSKWVDEAFKSTKAMKNFLFGKNSKVEDGNDYYTGPNEEDCPLEYAEGYRFMKDNEKWFKENLFLSDEENKDYNERAIDKLKREKYIIEMKIRLLEGANKK